jgi:DNA-binding IclR family transcriptional regulator
VVAPSRVSPRPPVAEEEDAKGSQTLAAVERAADILLYFTKVNFTELGITEIANGLGISKAVVHRMLASLRSRDLIAYDEATRRYALGPAALMLGLTCLDRLDVRKLAAAALPALSQATGETATLSVLAGNRRVYVDQATPDREVIMSVSIGIPFPLHAGASSKAFLAFLPPDQVDAYLNGSLDRLTDATITDERKLRRELKLIQKRGWAESVAERQSGAASVAAPILDHRRMPVAVISVCGPADRFATGHEAAVEKLLRTTSQLSARLGHTVRA